MKLLCRCIGYVFFPSSKPPSAIDEVCDFALSMGGFFFQMIGNYIDFHRIYTFSRYPENNTDWNIFFTFSKLALETVI